MPSFLHSLSTSMTYIDQIIENYEKSSVSKYYVDLSGTEEEEYEGNEDAIFYRPIEDFIHRSLFNDKQGQVSPAGKFRYR